MSAVWGQPGLFDGLLTGRGTVRGCGEVSMSNIRGLARSLSFDGHLMDGRVDELGAARRAWPCVDSSSTFIKAYAS